MLIGSDSHHSSQGAGVGLGTGVGIGVVGLGLLPRVVRSLPPAFFDTSRVSCFTDPSDSIFGAIQMLFILITSFLYILVVILTRLAETKSRL